MTILFCHCAYSQIIPESVKQCILKGLGESGIAYTEVADLCELAARRDDRLESLGQTKGLKLIACYPRAIQWLFAAAGATMPSGEELFNMRTDSPETILSRLKATEAGSETSCDLASTTAEDRDSDWVPWFPVIDYDRCSGCQQCLNFCLFGVFTLDEQGKVIVKNPQNCKTNCPACARVCPQAAIIFPKFSDSPINGAEVCKEDLDGQMSGVDITEVLKGDIYDKLRQRNKTSNERFVVETDTDTADPEPCACSRSARLREDLNIPDEVIQSISGSNTPSEACDCDCNCTTDSDCDGSGPDKPQGKGCCCE